MGRILLATHGTNTGPAWVRVRFRIRVRVRIRVRRI